MQDLPALVPEIFSNSEDGDEADEEEFGFPAGMQQLVCEYPAAPCNAFLHWFLKHSLIGKRVMRLMEMVKYLLPCWRVRACMRVISALCLGDGMPRSWKNPSGSPHCSSSANLCNASATFHPTHNRT